MLKFFIIRASKYAYLRTRYVFIHKKHLTCEITSEEWMTYTEEIIANNCSNNTLISFGKDRIPTVWLTPNSKRNKQLKLAILD